MSITSEIKKAIIDETRVFQNKLFELKEIAKVFVQDKSHSLDERWEIFVECNLGEEQCWMTDFGPLTEDSYFHNIERYKTVDLQELLEEKDEDFGIGSFFTKEQIIEIKEAILQKFIKSIKIDW